MELKDCIKKIEKYFDTSDNHPRIVNINDVTSLIEFKKHFAVGDNKFLSAKDYSLTDENPNIDKLIYDLSIMNGNVFVTEITTHLKLYGEKCVEDFLNNILHTSFSGKIIIVCYQCKRNLKQSDPRAQRLIYTVESRTTQKPSIFLVSNHESIPKGVVCENGIEHLGHLIENNDVEQIYIYTKKSKKNYESSLYVIQEERNPFDVLKNIDIETLKLKKEYGTDDNWKYAVECLRRYGSWNQAISNIFGTCSGLEHFISKWKQYDENKGWLYYISLKLYEPSNWCLQQAIALSNNKSEVIRNIYRCILNENLEDVTEIFWERYFQRKKILQAIGPDSNENIEFCNIVKCKDEKYIYMLTDNTQVEKECILEYLSIYGEQKNRSQIVDVIKKIYPDLYYYLTPFNFKNDLLDNYFQDYKYQKVVNKIFPEFKAVVEEQAKKRDFNLFPVRASKIEEIDKNKTALYFIDALGVEYLGYILHECKENNLIASVDICRCNLPSLTSYNKEFITEFEEKGCSLIGNTKGIKEIDKIKHEGMNGVNYQISQIPIHLIAELQELKKIIDKINNDIARDIYDKAIIISDHGASRLAVINENENKWEMNSKGEHSGRCCPVNELDDVKIDVAIKENDYWVLANYDRFKGGRRSDVEVHGGASLEEVMVPIIQVERKNQNIEIVIKTPKIKFNIRDKNAVIKLYSTHKIYDVSIEINNKIYNAFTEDNQNFSIELPDLNKAMEYTVKVYSGNNLLADDLKFIAEKEGFVKRKLF